MTTYFKDGLKFENHNLVIPWSFSKNDLQLYFPEEIKPQNIDWKNITSFNGIKFHKIVAQYRTNALGNIAIHRFTFLRETAGLFKSVDQEFEDTINKLTALFGRPNRTGEHEAYRKFPHAEWDIGNFRINCSIQERFVEWCNLTLSKID